jgi:tetratricopeptide (TPR) repeat protein
MLYIAIMRGTLSYALLVSVALFAQDRPASKLFQDAVDAQQRGDLASAISRYHELLRLAPNLPDAHANLGAALAALGQYPAAITEYQTALRITPSQNGIRFNLALAFYKSSRFDEAAREFAALRRSDPNDARIATLLADSYSRLNQDPRAVEVLAPLLPAHSADMDLTYVLGSALIRSGKAEEGVRLVEQVAANTRSADAYLLSGATRLSLNQKDEAIRNFEAASALSPNLPGLHTQLGIAKEGSGDLDGAESELRRALNQNPADFEATVHLAGILYGRRDLKQARLFVDRALEIKPTSTFALYERALIESASGDQVSAAGDLEKVTAEDPHWLDPHVQLSALYYKLRRPAEGQRERDIVQRLLEEQQNSGSTSSIR